MVFNNGGYPANGSAFIMWPGIRKDEVSYGREIKGESIAGSPTDYDAIGNCKDAGGTTYSPCNTTDITSYGKGAPANGEEGVILTILGAGGGANVSCNATISTYSAKGKY